MTELKNEDFKRFGTEFDTQVQNLNKYIHKCNGLKPEQISEMDKQITDLKEENKRATAEATEEVAKIKSNNLIYKSYFDSLEEKLQVDKDYNASLPVSRANTATQEQKDKHMANEQKRTDATKKIEQLKNQLNALQGGARKKKKTAEKKSSKGKRRSNSKSKGKGRKNSKPSKK